MLACGSIAVIALGCATAAEADGAAGARVRAMGDAMVSREPDRAIVRVAVVTEAKTAEPAVAENAKRSDALVKAMRELLGDDAELAHQGYSLSPRYEYDRQGGGGRVLQGYTVRSALRVRFDDVEQVGRVIDVATSNGANEVESVTFTLRDDTAARAEALRKATQAARAKADVMAQAIGESVARVVAVEEAGAVLEPRTLRGGSLAFAAADKAAETPMEVGDVSVRASVRIEVELTGER
jgi:uncharacterized protein YggE